MDREICVKEFSGTTAPRILNFDTNIGYDYLYRARGNQHPHAYHFLYLSSLFFSYTIFVKYISVIAAPRILNVVTNIWYDLLYC